MTISQNEVEALGGAPGPGGAPTGCAIGDLFALLGKPHMLSVLHSLAASPEPLRFRDLEARLRIPPKTLSHRLRVLVERGFLVRRAYQEIPPRVEYAPTPKLTALGPLFEMLNAWAREHTLTAPAVVTRTGARPARSSA